MQQHPTQLLCTFSTDDQLDTAIKKIIDTYEIAFNTIYVLENIDAPTSLCCTYNIITTTETNGVLPEATISLHRKKATNTLYTINALNILVAQLNAGKMDREFLVPWEDFKNTILVTAYGSLKRINTKLKRIIKVNEIK
jgi:hypothetical protein